MNKGMNMETTYTYDVYSFSDLHKDAYGRRPGNYYFEWLEKATDAERQVEWDFLCRTADQRERERLEDQAKAWVEFDHLVERMMDDNRIGRADAVRWLHDAHRTGGDNQYLDYSLGVAYGTIDKFLAQPEVVW